jgi:transposase InsO family protein
MFLPFYKVKINHPLRIPASLSNRIYAGVLHLDVVNLAVTSLSVYCYDPLVFDTFDKAIAANPGASALCHSDRGFQYTSRNFHAKLEAAGMTQRMSRVTKCIDNGPMEWFWGILKRERYYGKRFTDRTPC